MRPVNEETIRQMVDLCSMLLVLADKACTSESNGEGSILAYSLVSECASWIQSAAEERRHSLARHQWKEVGETAWWLHALRDAPKGTNQEARSQDCLREMLESHSG